MRLEQLVLFGPSDNFCVQFGPRVTVLAGLEADERASMVETLVAAMAGQLPNASVIFVDAAGRRVYADRVGATYADSGVAAPSLSELIGTDPAVVSELVTLRAEDLGLGDGRDEGEIHDDLASARAQLAIVTEEQQEATTIVVELDAWQRDLDRLDEEIARAPEEQARWEWIQLRTQLDAVRAELASLDRVDEASDDADARLLGAVEDLRSAGEAWAEASAEATELAQRLGPLPPVSRADMARVAATPEALPADFDERIAAVEVADELRIASEGALASATAPAEDPGDGIVFQLASVDQDALWKAHRAAVKAQAHYDAEKAKLDDQVDPETENEIELAHREVVQCQRVVDQRFRPGVLGASALLAAGVLAALTISILVTIAAIAGAVALAVALIVKPRQALALAEREEEMALGSSEAESWLGIHLLRIDDVMQPSDRTSLNIALDRRTSTRIDWDELSGGTSLEAAGDREAAIRDHAAAIDPRERAVRARVATDALEHATQEAARARHALTDGLEAYGLPADGAADLAPTQIRALLEQRTAAGRFARQALALLDHQDTATEAGTRLDALLRDLGFDDGDLAGRLERAIVSVEAARRRRQISEDVRSRDELEAEAARLGAEVDRRRRMSWDLLPDPDAAPAPLAELMDARRALAERLAERRRPNVSDLERRVAVAADRVAAAEAELAALAEGPVSLRRRLADRIARTGWLGGQEETLPLLIDDALADVAPSELFDLLDMVVRLSDRTQIVLLSSDPTIAKWARREAAHGIISVFEADGVAVS